jgi:hypothetical protein
MPLYTFATTHNGKVMDADEPLDLRDITAAWHEATKFAGETLRDMDGGLAPNTTWSLEIREDGKPVRTIRIVTEGSK